MSRIDTLGLLIRERRQNLGLSTAALARAADTTRQHISSLENCKSWSISEDIIIRIAKILMINEDELLGAAGKIKSDVLELYSRNAAMWAEKIREYYREKNGN